MNKTNGQSSFHVELPEGSPSPLLRKEAAGSMNVAQEPEKRTPRHEVTGDFFIRRSTT